MLTSFSVQETLAQATPNQKVDLKALTTLTPEQTHNIAEKIKSLDLCEANSKSTVVAYNKCLAADHPQLAWWQSPEYAIGAPLLTIILTLLVTRK